MTAIRSRLTIVSAPSRAEFALAVFAVLDIVRQSTIAACVRSLAGDIPPFAVKDLLALYPHWALLIIRYQLLNDALLQRRVYYVTGKPERESFRRVFQLRQQ